LKAYMKNQLEAHFEGVSFNGESGNLENSLYTVLNASFPPSENNEMLLFNLDIQKVSVSGGSACSSGSSVGSHVLTALRADPNRASVRFSFSKNNTRNEVDFALQQLKEIFSMDSVNA
jgi:cysteine desulfurase